MINDPRPKKKSQNQKNPRFVVEKLLFGKIYIRLEKKTTVSFCFVVVSPPFDQHLFGQVGQGGDLLIRKRTSTNLGDASRLRRRNPSSTSGVEPLNWEVNVMNNGKTTESQLQKLTTVFNGSYNKGPL